MRNNYPPLIEPDDFFITGSDVRLVVGYHARPGWLSPEGDYYTSMFSGLGSIYPHGQLGEGIIYHVYQQDPDKIPQELPEGERSRIYGYLYARGWVKVDSESIDPAQTLPAPQIVGLYRLFQKLSDGDPMKKTIKKTLEQNDPMPIINLRGNP